MIYNISYDNIFCHSFCIYPDKTMSSYPNNHTTPKDLNLKLSIHYQKLLNNNKGHEFPHIIHCKEN